jgi:hypothetical protein
MESLMEYRIFLFSQLFMKHVENNETEYQELEYDLIYPEVLKHYDTYCSSSYYLDEILPEYDCIVNYLQNEIKNI